MIPKGSNTFLLDNSQERTLLYWMISKGRNTSLYNDSQGENTPLLYDFQNEKHLFMHSSYSTFKLELGILLKAFKLFMRDIN